jgi:hypothetical protein
MSATYETAVDEMLTVIKTAWDTPWARTSIQHFTGRQSSLTGGLGTTRWARAGTLTVQIFVPRGNGLSLAYQLAKIVGDSLEGGATPSGVWFRNVRLVEAGADGNFEQLNIKADFTYDEVK